MDEKSRKRPEEQPWPSTGEPSWQWPMGPAELEAQQCDLAAAADEVLPWEARPASAEPASEPGGLGDIGDPVGLGGLTVAAVFAAFPRGEGGPGDAGQPVMTAAVLWRDGRVVNECVVRGASGGPYIAGLLALRCGAQLEAAVAGLGRRHDAERRPDPAWRPDLVLVDATGRDHPRRAGLALHLGARLGLPSVGVTSRVLVADYDEPSEARGSASPLRADEELVGYAVRTRAGARPVLAHAAWRTTPELARDVVLALSGRWRTPLPLRAARTLAREARAALGGASPPDVCR